MSETGTRLTTNVRLRGSVTFDGLPVRTQTRYRPRGHGTVRSGFLHETGEKSGGLKGGTSRLTFHTTCSPGISKPSGRYGNVSVNLRTLKPWLWDKTTTMAQFQ